MRRIKWFLFGLAFVMVPALAFADSYPGQERWQGQYVASYHETPALAGVANCQANYRTFSHVTGPYNNGTQYLNYCFQSGSSGSTNLFGSMSRSYWCPHGGTLSGAQVPGVQCINAPACPEGQMRNPTTGQCEAPPCEAGSLVSSGYYDVGTNDKAEPPLITCHNGCAAGFENIGGISRALVEGQYHYYYRGGYSLLGPQETCTVGEGATGGAVPTSAQALPAPSCAADQYKLNDLVTGQPRCVNISTGEPVSPYAPKTSTETKTVQTVDNGDGTTTTTETTTGADGSTRTTTTTSGPNGSTSTTEVQQPGTEPTEEPGEPCGGEGQPACKVKVDESDMPEFDDTLGGKLGELDTIWNERIDGIEGEGWRITDLSFAWSPPVPSGGSCSAWALFGQSIDICTPLGKARDIWAWVIYVLTGWFIWRRGVEAIGGGSK